MVARQVDLRPNISKQGVRGVVLDATPTGSALVTIADFTGAPDVNIATNAAALPLTEWIARSDSQTNGTSWLLLRPGEYEVQFNVANAGATRLQAGILRGNAAPPANPIWSAGIRILAAYDVLGAAAGSFDTVTLRAKVKIASGDIDGNNNMVRLMLSNAAGAAPTGLVVAECGWSVQKSAPISSLA